MNKTLKMIVAGALFAGLAAGALLRNPDAAHSSTARPAPAYDAAASKSTPSAANSLSSADAAARVTGGALFSKNKVAAAMTTGTKVAAPLSVDLRAWAMPVANQGQVSSCVGWAIDYAMLGWYARHDGVTGAPFAPMYVYSQINGGVDGGSWPKDAFNLLLQQGTDTRSDYWQGDFDWATQPTAAERANAANYKISGFQILFAGTVGQGAAAIASLQNALGAGKPVAIAMTARAGLRTLTAGGLDTDNVTTPLGGHAMLAVGYDQNGLLVQNSWGTTWGDQGFGRIAWDVVSTDVVEAETISGLVPTQTVTPTKITVGALNVAVAPGFHLSATAPVKVSWTATGGTLANYVLYVSTNGGQWVDASARLSSPTATSAALSLTPGSTYRFAVAAVNSAGQQGEYSYSATFTANVASEATATLSAGWKSYSWAQALGGQAVTSSTAGSTATYSFTGRSIAWVAPKFSTAGQANVYIDGKFVTTVDLYKATLDPASVVFSWFWTSSAAHSITVQVVGTNGRPRVDLDAFIVLT